MVKTVHYKYRLCHACIFSNRRKPKERSFTPFRRTCFVVWRLLSFSNVCHSERSEESCKKSITRVLYQQSNGRFMNRPYGGSGGSHFQNPKGATLKSRAATSPSLHQWVILLQSTNFRIVLGRFLTKQQSCL